MRGRRSREGSGRGLALTLALCAVLPGATARALDEEPPPVTFSEAGQADWDALEPTVADGLVEVLPQLAADPLGEDSSFATGELDGAREHTTADGLVVRYRLLGGGIEVLRISLPSRDEPASLPPPLVRLTGDPVEAGAPGPGAPAAPLEGPVVDEATDATDAAGWIDRGNAQLAHGDCTGARESFKEARRADYQLAEPSYGLARTFDGQGQTRSAARWYRAYAKSTAEDAVEDRQASALARAIDLHPSAREDVGRSSRWMLIGAGSVAVGAGLVGLGVLALSAVWTTESILLLVTGVILTAAGGALAIAGVGAVGLFSILLTEGVYGGKAPWPAVAAGWVGLFGLAAGTLGALYFPPAVVLLVLGVFLPVQVVVAAVLWARHQGRAGPRPPRLPPQLCHDAPALARSSAGTEGGRCAELPHDPRSNATWALRLRW